MRHIKPVLKIWAKADILEALAKVKVPCGPINTIQEALTSEQAQARDVVREMAVAGVKDGKVQLLGNPLKFSKTPVKYRRPPPRFGQDTDEVLATWLGDKP